MHDIGASGDGVFADGLGDRIGEPPVATAGIVGVSGEGVEAKSAAVEDIAVEGGEAADVALAGGIIDVDKPGEADRISAGVFFDGAGMEVDLSPGQGGAVEQRGVMVQV